MLFWFCGAVYAIAGTHVFIEYGLNIPRYPIKKNGAGQFVLDDNMQIEGKDMAVPRSGGVLNYVSKAF
jgi:hypothetical protein